jgi:hypothetical protein
MATIPAPLPYNLRIGVTGHRDLPHPAEAARAVDDLLDHIARTLQDANEFPRGKCGANRTLSHRAVEQLAHAVSLFWRSLPVRVWHTPPERRTPIEWTVISPLARGADRIVAHAVLKRSTAAHLQALLPFPVDDYRQDFKDPGDREEFEDLLKRDSTPINLKSDYGLREAGDSPEQTEEKHARRNEGYMRVGQRVVDACEILIAIWNGEPAAGHGGTAEIVQYAVEQGRVVLWINSNNPADPVRLLVNRPEPDAKQELPTTTCGIPYRSLPETAKEFSSNFHQMAAFNRAPAFNQKEFDAIVQRNQDRLLQVAAEAKLPTHYVSDMCTRLLPYYSLADQLALRYQALYFRGAKNIYLFSALAVTTGVVQVLFFHDHPSVIGFEITAMVLALIFLLISRTEAWHEKWLHNRHLAERIRMAMFTSLVNLSRTPASPHTALPFYPGPEGWVIDAVEYVVNTGKPAARPDPPLEPVKKFVVEAWIADQAKYHANNARKKKTAAHRARQDGIILYGITLLMAVLHLAKFGHRPEGSPYASVGEIVGLGIAGLAIALPAWGAAAHAVNVLLESERIAARSRRMAPVLSTIAQRASQAASIDALRDAVAKAEEVMAAENHEWWVSLSFRELVLL